MIRDCPDGSVRDLLPDFVLGTLAEGERVRVGRHVAGCTDCAAEVALIRSARAALDAAAPAVDVARIVASLPHVPSAARRAAGRLATWRVAAAVGLVALGGLSVGLLRGIFAGVPDAAHAVTPAVVEAHRPAPDSSPVARRVPLTARAREVSAAPREEGVSFGGGFSDLTDDQLKTLLQEIDALQATPSAEPEVHATPIIPLHEGEHHAL